MSVPFSAKNERNESRVLLLIANDIVILVKAIYLDYDDFIGALVRAERSCIRDVRFVIR